MMRAQCLGSYGAIPSADSLSAAENARSYRRPGSTSPKSFGLGDDERIPGVLLLRARHYSFSLNRGRGSDPPLP